MAKPSVIRTSSPKLLVDHAMRAANASFMQHESAHSPRDTIDCLVKKNTSIVVGFEED